MRTLTLIAFLVFSGSGVAAAQDTAAPPAQPPRAEAEPAIVAEARAMMEAYADALRAGDRAAIANLYDRRGAWLFWEGRGGFETHDAITRRYVEQWDPPAAFAWRDLVFIPTGPDTITVGGRFDWTPPGAAAMPAFYHGQLVRQDGRLRLHIEHEGRVAPD